MAIADYRHLAASSRVTEEDAASFRSTRESSNLSASRRPDHPVLVLERQRLAQGDGTPAEGITPLPGAASGTLRRLDRGRGCMDVTALNPPPSPGEVFSYFERLPLPTLTTQHQPPGNGLTGLPVIFYTDSPTTQTLSRWLEEFLYKHATLITGQTQGIVDNIRFRFADKQVELITNGVDVRAFGPASDSNEKSRIKTSSVSETSL